MKIEDLLLEKAPLEVSKFAHVVYAFLADGLPIRDGKRRGEGYDDTGAYQIRIMPADPKNPGDLLNNTLAYVKSAKGKKMGIKNVKMNVMSPHSHKFSSVQFDIGEAAYDIVVAAGANKGESFEDDTLLKLNNFVAGVEDDVEAAAAFEAIRKVEPSITLKKIDTIVKRKGKTQRSDVKDSDEAGKIIADLIIKMKGGKEHYISLKNATGSNVAQFGISGVFDDNLIVDTSSTLWKNWIAPFGMDPKKITAGLQSYVTKQKPKFPTEETLNKKLAPSSPAYKLLENMWGTGYIYLREKKGGWEAMKIDKEYLAQDLLKGLKIVKILYPSPERKAAEVHLQFAGGGYKVRMRNKNDPKSVKPTIIQLEKTK